MYKPGKSKIRADALIHLPVPDVDVKASADKDAQEYVLLTEQFNDSLVPVRN